MSTKITAWSYEDFVFLVENMQNYSLWQIAQKLQRSKGSVYATLNVIRQFQKGRSPDVLIQMGYSRSLIDYCRKYFNHEDIDVVSKRYVGRPRKQPVPVLPQTQYTELSSEVQLMLVSLDEQLDVLKQSMVRVISKVLEDSSSARILAENKQLKEEIAAMKEKVADLDKYKQAAKDSSVWGVLTRKFTVRQ